MPNTRFVIANKLEVVGGAKVRKDDRILLIGKPPQSPLAVEPDENSVIKRRWKARRRKGDVVSALAFGTGEWIGQWLKGKQGLDATAADRATGAILGVIRRISKVRDRAGSQLGCGYKVELVGAERFVGIGQAINPVILKIKIAARRVKDKTGRIAQALGQPGQMGGDHVREVIRKGQHIDGLTLKSARGPRDLRTAQRHGIQSLGEVLVRPDLKQEVATAGLAGRRPRAQ